MSPVSSLLLTMWVLAAAPTVETEPDAPGTVETTRPDGGDASTAEPGGEPDTSLDANASGDGSPEADASEPVEGSEGQPTTGTEPPDTSPDTAEAGSDAAGDGASSDGRGEPAEQGSGEPDAGAKDGSDATSKDGAGDDKDDAGDEGDGDGKTKKKDKKKKKKLSWSIGSRIMAGWEGEVRRPLPEDTETEPWAQELFLRQARVKFRINYKKIFGIRASIELRDALRSPNFDRVNYLRNGYAKIRFHDAARLHVGYFKRPFSRLELRSPGRLPFRGRGLANDRIIEDRNYGDRSVGGMLWGKIRPARMRYYVSTFAPALRTDGIDAIGRLRADPFEWGSVGVSGGYKRVRNGIGDMVNVASANADLRFKYKGLYFMSDLVLGQDYLVPGEPWMLGLVGYVRYDIDLPKKFVLQPVVLTEWADVNIEISQNDAIRSVFGVNVIWRKRLRVMPQVELIRPRGVIDNPWNNKDTYYVMLSLDL